MENNDLVEEYPREYESTQFEKVLIASRRAKDIHNSKKTPLIDSNRKAGYIALEEIKAKKIEIVYPEEEEIQEIGEEKDEAEEASESK